MKGYNSFYVKYTKRVLDIICSSLSLLVLGIPMLVVALLIRIDLGKPVLFKQKRIGKDNKEFLLLKFRSMNEKRDENGVYLPDEKRITKLGEVIRRFSIDELPSLFNVLKSDMSIIGPRPLPARYLPRYTEKQKHRHDIKPGLSSPSTTNGRNQQTWEKQFEGDLWYVENASFITDVKSVVNTIKTVLLKEGVTAEDGGARLEFIGLADPNDLKTDSEGNYMKLKEKE